MLFEYHVVTDGNQKETLPDVSFDVCGGNFTVFFYNRKDEKSEIEWKGYWYKTEYIQF